MENAWDIKKECLAKKKVEKIGKQENQEEMGSGIQVVRRQMDDDVPDLCTSWITSRAQKTKTKIK